MGNEPAGSTRPPAVRLAGGSILLLMAWLAFWLWNPAPDGAVTGLTVLMLAWAPLAPAVPLIYRGSRKAAGWIALVGVIYAGLSTMEVVANPAARWWATSALVLSGLMVVFQVRMIRST